MTSLKVIKTDEDHNNVLVELEQLLNLDPELGTPENDRLEVLSLLLESYESAAYPIDPPDPIDAIKFRMEQQGLRQRDLVPYIGNRSKVSEVLNRKRGLSLAMIRALNSGLGIPASVLVQEPEAGDAIENFDWEKYPAEEMLELGWIRSSQDDLKKNGEKILREFLDPFMQNNFQSVYCRRTRHIRSGRRVNTYALEAWCARVLSLARERDGEIKKRTEVTLAFMQEVAKLSSSERGPALARDYLLDHGILLIVVPMLKRTYLDGSALKMGDAPPIIGITIRYDRLDGFWFTLMHELAHLSLHGHEDACAFFDDLEVKQAEDSLEKQADDLAQEALIPGDYWETMPSCELRTQKAVRDIASDLQISPAIVAGRMRYEDKNYRRFSKFVGHHQVRKFFPEVNWN